MLFNKIKQQDHDNYSSIDKIYMLRIQIKQNINISLKTVKTLMLNGWKIERLVLNIQII